MYPTGVGHFYDATRPDIPLFSAARYGLWKLYLSSALGLLPEAKATWYQALFDGAGQSQKRAKKSNQYALRELAKLESDAAESRGVRTKPLARNLAERPCQEVVAPS